MCIETEADKALKQEIEEYIRKFMKDYKFSSDYLIYLEDYYEILQDLGASEALYDLKGFLVRVYNNKSVHKNKYFQEFSKFLFDVVLAD